MALLRRDSPDTIHEEHPNGVQTSHGLHSPVSTRSSISRSRASSSSGHSLSGMSLSSSVPATATATATVTGTTTTAILASTSSSPYHPAFSYRNKPRTPSVSSTSTITPIHNLLQTSAGILLPKRQPTTSTSASSTTSLVAPRTSSPPATATTTIAVTSASFTPMATAASNPILVLEPVNDSFAIKSLDLPEHTRVKIGRQTGVTTAPNPSNGYFDSKVLSRIHAEVWSDQGKVYLRDLKSSNGTFLNGKRLCPENVESEPFVLNQNDSLEFGIDILDEQGALLHEKVACKIYISRMSYPTPGGSPQDAHAKLRSSPSTSSVNSLHKSNSTTTTSGTNPGGQSANMDVIISRLQNELTRSQETNADLGALKRGLGDLEKVFVVTTQDGQKSGTLSGTGNDALVQVSAAVDYEKLLEKRTLAHADEMAKMQKSLQDTQSELEAYIQKTRLMEPLVAEDEILRRNLAQSMADVTQIKLERDLVKDSMNEMMHEHKQALETLQQEQEAALAQLKADHQNQMEVVAREAALANELLTLKFQQDLAQALEAAAAVAAETPTLAEDTVDEYTRREEALLVQITALETEKASLTATIQTLERSVKQQATQIQELATEKSELAQDLIDTKKQVTKALANVKELELQQSREDLSSLTPTSPTNASSSSISHHAHGGREVTTTTSTSKETNGVVSKYEFSWAQFVLPMGKRNPPHSNQPSTILMSGGFMLVGIGAYVFWHKVGLTSN